MQLPLLPNPLLLRGVPRAMQLGDGTMTSCVLGGTTRKASALNARYILDEGELAIGGERSKVERMRSWCACVGRRCFAFCGIRVPRFLCRGWRYVSGDSESRSSGNDLAGGAEEDGAREGLRVGCGVRRRAAVPDACDGELDIQRPAYMPPVADMGRPGGNLGAWDCAV